MCSHFSSFHSVKLYIYVCVLADLETRQSKWPRAPHADACVIIVFPQKAIQASNALTYGLKDKRRYRWYSVWDIWRRLLFVAVNVFLGFTTRSVVVVCDVTVRVWVGCEGQSYVSEGVSVVWGSELRQWGCECGVRVSV